jgi:2-keto-4-pentenoate hydratase
VSATSHQEIASLLRQAAADRRPCPPVRGLAASADIEAAYEVQRINTQMALDEGRRIVGYKVGLTSRAVQLQLGVDQPDFGVLFADMAVEDSLDIDLDRVLQPRAEAEIAFVLGGDLLEGPVIASELMRAIAFALPAIEIVGSRIENWDIKIFDTVADNASSGLFVLGNSPRKLDQLDLRMCGMRLDHKGEAVSTGLGAACLGNPLNAALWLANTLLRNGQALRAGDVILSGALGPMVAATVGAYEASISGLGSVRAQFHEAVAR